MQKPLTGWGWRMCKEKELSGQKKEFRSLSAVTSGVTKPKSFLLVVEGAMCSSLNEALANLSTSGSRLFY